MNLKNIDREAIERSYRRQNLHRFLVILHVLLPFALIIVAPAFPELYNSPSFWPFICILPFTMSAHIVFLLVYVHIANKFRRSLGDKHIVVPVAKSPNYETLERVPQYIRTADGELLEIMEDEAAEFDIEPTAPDELQMD